MRRGIAEARDAVAPGPHGRAETADAKADLAQCPREQSVLFVAKAAAPAIDDLRVVLANVEFDGLAPLDVEILERHSHQMRALQGFERRRIDPLRAVVADAGEVSVEVHRAAVDCVVKALVLPAGKRSVTITARVTDHANRTRSVSHARCDIGAPGANRTRDPWLRRPILYPLSYGRMQERELQFLYSPRE